MDKTLAQSDIAERQPPAAAGARLWEIDTLRGLAVVLMVFYHFVWDLHYVGLYRGDIDGAGWQSFARSIGSTFMMLLGLSLTLTYSRRGARGFRPYLLRGLKILACGMGVTAVTYLALPDDFVIFGILHLLGLSTILAYPLLRARPWAALLAGLACLAAGAWANQVVIDSPWLIWLGVLQAGRSMADYYPLLPWFGVVLLGVWAGLVLYPRGARSFFVLDELGDAPLLRGLRFLGRHSLPIYLVHQPILLGALFALGYGTL
jgi:uncharacterized membrane protein